MKQNIFVFLFLFYLISSPVAAVESHCNEQEQIIFSCSVGKNIVSVCASKAISNTDGFIQYRFGKKNAPELIFPNAKTVSNHSMIKAKTLMFSGGGGAYLRFISGQYSYIVYTAIGKGWGTKEGVAVEKNETLLANLMCQDVPISMLGEEFFTRAGLLGDENEFSLP